MTSGARRSAILAGLLVSLADTFADNLDEWTLQSVEPYLAGVACSSDCLVAVGNGSVLYSSNAVNWLSVEVPGIPVEDVDFWGVAFGNGRFVAAGYQFVPGSSDGIILTSSNGLQWSLTRAVSNALYGIDFVNGQFLAVGNLGFMLASTDGINWQPRVSGTSEHLFSVAFGSGVYVAVGNYYNTTILTSTDGTNWSTKTPPNNYSAESVAYGQGRFVIVTLSRYYWSSAGGTYWSQDAVPWTNAFSHPQLRSIKYANGGFVSVGVAYHEGPVQGILFTSADGQTWVQRPSIIVDQWSDSVFWDDTIVVVGDGIIQSQPFSGPKRPPSLLADPQSKITLSNALVSLSVAGACWPPLSFQWRKNSQPLAGMTDSSLSVRANATTAGDYSVVASNSTGSVTSSVAVLTVVNRIALVPPSRLPATAGEDLTIGITTSSNSSVAYQWRMNQQYLPNATNSTVTITNIQLSQAGRYDVIVANTAGAVASWPFYVTVEPYSDHPLYNWADHTPEALSSYETGLSGVAYGNGIFVTVGYFPGSDFGVILSSGDGATWTRRMAPPPGQFNPVYCLYDLAFGNGTFVAVGYVSSIYTSTNGTDWVLTRSGPYGTYYNRVVFSDGAFWAGQTGGQTLRSTDGIAWQDWPSWPGYSDLPVAAAGLYVTISNSPPGVFVSTDAVAWDLAYANGHSLSDVTFGRGTFVAVGTGGTIVQSDPLAQIGWDPGQSGRLIIQGLVGREYLIEQRNSLDGTSGWTQFATIVLTNNPVQVPVFCESPTGQSFFRSALLP